GKVVKYNYKNKAIRALGIHFDISEQKEKEKELELAKKKAQESDKLKSAFLANMSHEIRTPMNAIIGFLGLMKDIESEEKKDYYTKIINQNAEALMSIITDIIDISKIESNQIDIIENKINPNNLLIELHASFQNEKLNPNHNKYIIKKLDNGDYTFSSDEEKVRRILTNLLSNAMKFTQNGNIELGYRILKQDKPQIQFYVKDDGIGIEEENKKAIFEHFRQAELELTRNYGGTGIGLSIAKGFANILGGKITFDSEINKGSIFNFTLPYDGSYENIKTNDMHETESEDFDYSKQTILVVEDEFFNFEYINEILLLHDIKVVYAKDGIEAIDAFKNNNIDLILMDIKMPVMNGLDATREIKKINSNIPIIAQTAHALTGDKEKILEAGCDNYISKPIEKNMLMEIINEHLK
ncbi:MAG: response regulator, partial [Bacteroidota bacterium]|nr:response regulator [Bacteroidota bacterium]